MTERKALHGVYGINERNDCLCVCKCLAIYPSETKHRSTEYTTKKALKLAKENYKHH